MKYKLFNHFFYISLLFILCGILCIINSAEVVLHIVYNIICIIILIIGIFKLVMSNKRDLGQKEFVFDIIEGAVNIVVGVVCINFYHHYLVNLICGIAYLVVPLLRVFFAQHKINQLIFDIFKFIFAGFIIATTQDIPEIGKYYISAFFLVFGIGLMSLKLIKYYRFKKNMFE